MNERRAQLLIVGTKLSNDRELYRTIILDTVFRYIFLTLRYFSIETGYNN